MTERIHDFLRRRRDNGLDDGPCLVVDLDVVRDNYRAFAKALPDSRVFYAVKANPAAELLSLLASLGSCFDTASIPEIELVLAAGAGLVPYGVSFHVGSQQRNQHAWDQALASAAAVFRECGERGIELAMVNLGGGFPAKYLKNVPSVQTYGTAIFKALRKHFRNRIPETIIEP